MFNNFYGGKTSQSVEINAVTGAILKNHPKSWFECFHLESDRAEALLREGGHKARKNVKSSYGSGYYTTDDPEHNAIVLQMIICGDMKVIAECVYQKDYVIDCFTGAPEGRCEEG